MLVLLIKNPLESNVVEAVRTSEKSTAETPCLENPKFGETIRQTNIDLVDVSKSPSNSLVIDPMSDVSKKIDVPIVKSLKKTATHSNVVLDVMTSLAQPDAHVETTQNNSHIESESESGSDNENSQHKMVTNDSKEQKVSDVEGEKTMPVSGSNGNSESEKHD